MALKKFISIERVGRLAKSTQKGPELNRYNLIFAENGRGKTTLCAVLRSLQTGKHEYITERKTVGAANGESAVSILFDGGTANYVNRVWSKTVPEIAIFDATFVAQNVHAGEHVGRDQRSNLLEIIVGEAGVLLARKVSELDEAIRVKNSDIAQTRKAVQQQLPKGSDLDAFLAFPEDTEIENKILAKSNEISAAKRAGEIRTRPALTEIRIPALADTLAPLLKKTLPDVSADAELRLNEHVARHKMGQHGKQWLSEGVAYVENENCPFCGQGLEDHSLVDAYKQFFSEAYSALRAEIEALRTDVATAFGDATLSTLGRTFATNEAACEFWKQFVKITVTAPDHDASIAAPLNGLKGIILSLVDQKLQNPLEAVRPDEALKSSSKVFGSITPITETYNVSVRASNKLIEAQKLQVQGANVVQLERDMQSLQLRKLRYDTKTKADCVAYTTAVADKAELDKTKNAAKLELDSHADTMIRDYETTINKLLKGFGAGFTLTNSKKTYIGGTPTSSYQILINNHPIDLGDDDTPIGQQCFRTTLSAGDKSTLALAFFIAQLDHDPTKAKKIVVFDDPFNSQDRSRRERTTELLKKCGQECQQLLLFSHDPFFLSLVYSKLPKNERHSIQLSRVADNYSTIEEWDVDKETQDGYFRDHASLNSYLIFGSKARIDIARKIRPVLEGYLRYRFPNQFPENEWLGDMIGRIRTAGAVHPLFTAYPELEGINDYSKKYHHDTNPGKADNEPINDGELQSYVQRSLAIAGGY